MRESGMWARGSSSYRTGSRPMEPPRSRYESHSYDQPEYDGDSRAFPPPSSRGYSGNSYNSGSPMDRPSREMRYGDGGGRMGPPHQGGGMGPPHSGSGMGPQGGMGGPQGPMMGPGPMGGGGMDSGPRGGNQPPMMNSGGSGGNSGYGGGGPGSGNSSGGGGGPNHAELYSSIQTLSQMNAQQNDIAAKLISAVLSTNLVKNMGGPQGPQGSPYPPNKMGSGYDDHGPFPPGRSLPVRGGGPRQFGPPGRYDSGRFDKFTRERRGRSPRVSFSGRLFKTGFDKPPMDPRKRPGTDLRRRLGSKRSWSDDPAKDDNSKFKRHRRSSEEMSENGEEREKGGRDEERSNAAKNESEPEKDGDSQSKDKEKEDELPTEALYCHMCKHGNFTSEKTYLYHLEGVRHRKTALAFHAKNEATLEYLRKNAKLAIIRFGGLDNTFAPSYCSICTALVKESFFKHKKLLEHKVVKKFLRPKCCGRFFKTRYEMDEHRLSLPHLKNIYNSNQKSEEMVVEEFFRGEPPKWSFDEAIKHLMSRNAIENQKISIDNIPPFDGNTFIGVEMLKSQEAVLCIPCRLVLPITAVGLESHVTSIDHYNKVLDYLGEKKKKELGSDVKKDDGDEETKRSSKEGRRGKDSDDDDDDDDDEGEEVPDDMRSLDDMKELANDMKDIEDIDKELPFIDESDHIVLEEIDGEDAPLKEVGEDVE